MPVSRDKESGFALLLVFLMAAVIAISLYSEIPRVAFQSQRQKEQLLVERGEQYKRAVEVFFQATNGQFPRSMDDLEKYQNRRFLRHKYVDPMTGKQEWRIIHVGPGGIPTDSALSKQAKKDETSGNVSNYVTAYPGLGQDTGAAGQQAMRPESRRRPSDSSPIGDSTLPVSSPDQPEQNQNPGAAQTASGAQPTGATPGAPAGTIGIAGAGDAANPANAGTAAGDASQAAAGRQGQPGTVIPGQSQNPAIAVLQGILGGPNPRGAPQGMPTGGGTSPGPASGGTAGGSGGVGGVASTSEMEGIMVFNDATSYDKWEFLFSPSTVVQVPALGTGQSGAPNMPVAPQQPRATGSGGSGGAGGRGGSQFPGGTQGPGSSGTGAPAAGGPSLPPVRMGRP